MKYRHMVTKCFDGGRVTRSYYAGKGQVYTRLCKVYGNMDKVSDKSEGYMLFPGLVSIGVNMEPVSRLLRDNEGIAKILLKDGEVSHLGEVFGRDGSSGMVGDGEMSGALREAAAKMFDNENPLTGGYDVSQDDENAECIPLVVLTDTFPPQVEGDKPYFNPKGSVTIAEFLDSLNAINNGCGSDKSRRKSLDNISDVGDFFNEGYQSCLTEYSGPFFNLYRRPELLNRITRLELAYITVFCWSGFAEKYGGLYGNEWPEGISFSWETASGLLGGFQDGRSYKVAKKSGRDGKSLEVGLKAYAPGGMSDLMDGVRQGTKAIPYPMFMSLLELSNIGLFCFEGGRLDPARCVSRGELACFLVRLASAMNARTA